VNFGAILVAFAICTAVFGCYCATRRVIGTKARAETPSRSPKLNLLPGTHFDGGYCPESNHLLFRLERPGSVTTSNGQGQHIGMSIEELEKCIPWIPQDKKVFICCPDGFEPSLLNRLSRIDTNRDLYLIQSMSSGTSSSDAIRRQAS
jgi:hypothetical protein